MSPGQEAEALARLDRGPREDDAPDALARERVDGGGDREIGLARSGRPDTDDDVVLRHQLQVLGLPAGLGLDDLADAGQRRCASRCRRRSRFLRAAPRCSSRSTSSAVSGICCLRGVDHSLRDWHRARHRFRGPADRQRLAAQRDLRACLLRQLDRFASFTPASVSMSAPSVERR